MVYQLLWLTVVVEAEAVAVVAGWFFRMEVGRLEVEVVSEILIDFLI